MSLSEVGSVEGDAAVLAKVGSARRRIMLASLARCLCVTLFIAMVIATIAIAMLAVIPIENGESPLETTPWIIGWLVGSAAIALLGSVAWTLSTAPSAKEVAAEIDRRFDLRERLSSSMESDLATESSFSPALRRDASAHAQALRIADQFPLQPTRVAWLPLAIAPIVMATIWTVRINETSTPPPSNIDLTEVKQVNAAASELKKRIAAQRRQAEAKGLKEAEELFAKMQAKLDDMAANPKMTRKEALLEMNDIRKQIEQRRERLGSPEQMRRTMSQMKGLQGGPIGKLAEQIRRGDFSKAAEEIKKLSQKIKEGQLSETEKKQLAKQAEQMAKQMQQAAKEHEQKKQQLRQQIEQAKREGRSQDASRLQQKLNQAEAADSQMQQMQQMAQSMQQAADAMQQGDGDAAAEAMQEMAGQLGQMQDEMSELEDLQDALGDLAQSKQQMNCKQCNGGGCQSCQGSGSGDGAGNGLGRGAGAGDRPEQEDETNIYDSQVRGEVRRGKAVIAGYADGPNRKGVTREQIKHVIDGAIQDEGDPLEDQVLPRDERDQTRQYFDRLRTQ
ncbi:MAG: hypothetical protein AAF670_05780 [Planctomycetota bacterium]